MIVACLLESTLGSRPPTQPDRGDAGSRNRAKAG